MATERELIEAVIHAVANVFTDPALQQRGYASRMMEELAAMLRSWQTDKGRHIGSVLYSDVGRQIYAKSGWHPFPNNNHLKFDPSERPKDTRVRPLLSAGLAEICAVDEAMIRRTMTTPASHGKLRMVIVPDLDYMLWHHAKEEFACESLFGTIL